MRYRTFVTTCVLTILYASSMTCGCLYGARHYVEGQIIDTTADNEFDIEVYPSPGWVTDTLDEGGVWMGNDDLDALKKYLRVVGQIVFPEGSGVGLIGKDIRRMVQKVFEDEIYQGTFLTDRKYKGEVLPFLHVSVAVLPSGLAYAIHCSMRLIEEIQIKRASWTREFRWQAATWSREKLFFSRRGQVTGDIQKAMSALTVEFINQFLTDSALRKEVDAEYAQIQREVDAEYLAIKKELEYRSEELEDVYQGEYQKFKERIMEEDVKLGE